jgi:hypothetical protein
LRIIFNGGVLKDAHEEAFATGDAWDEAIDGMMERGEQGALDVPFGRDRNGEDFGSEVIDNPLDVFLVFASVEGAGGIDEYATWFEARPDILDDGALELLALEHIIDGPLADGFLIFAEHALARAGHIAKYHIEEEPRTLVVTRIVAGNNDVGVALFLHVLHENIGSLSVGLVAEEQSIIR